MLECAAGVVLNLYTGRTPRRLPFRGAKLCGSSAPDGLVVDEWASGTILYLLAGRFGAPFFLGAKL